MKRISVLLLMMFMCAGLTEATLVLNGDFESPDITGTNQLTSVTSWISKRGDDKLVLDDKGTNDRIPGSNADTNQVARLKTGDLSATIRQFLGYGWAATDVYTLSFNASEVNWNAGEGTQNSIIVSLKDRDNGWDVLWTTTIDLDGTHDGSDPHGDWTAAQTFNFTIDASTFTTGGVGGELILEFAANENINWVDNASMVVPEPATLILLGIGGFVALRTRR